MRTSELTGAALDWAVALIEKPGIVGVRPDGKLGAAGNLAFSPSTNWAQGGPIIEREFLELRPGSFIGSKDCPRIFAAWAQNQRGGKTVSATGPTQLIAAMRCYVASKLGGDVEIPNELTGDNK
jgi:hypothetical protein